MDRYFNGLSEIKISTQKVGKQLNINICKRLTTQYGTTYFCYDKRNNCCFFANAWLRAFLEKIIKRLTSEDNTYFYLNQYLDKILSMKILSESRDKKTNRMVQKYSIKCYIEGYTTNNTNKTDQALDLNSEDNESS